MLILKLLRGTTIILYEFPAKQQKKKHKLQIKKFLLKLCLSMAGPVKVQKQSRNEIQEDYSSTEKSW